MSFCVVVVARAGALALSNRGGSAPTSNPCLVAVVVVKLRPLRPPQLFCASVVSLSLEGGLTGGIWASLVKVTHNRAQSDCTEEVGRPGCQSVL